MNLNKIYSNSGQNSFLFGEQIISGFDYQIRSVDSDSDSKELVIFVTAPNFKNGFLSVWLVKDPYKMNLHSWKILKIQRVADKKISYEIDCKNGNFIDSPVSIFVVDKGEYIIELKEIVKKLGWGE